MVTSRVDADWVVGELRGKKGMFPVNFVDSVPENLPKDNGEQKNGPPAHKAQQQSGPPQPAVTKVKVTTGSMCAVQFYINVYLSCITF